MLEEYYNVNTQTLTVPLNFDDELMNLPLDTKIIIFEENNNKNGFSKFDKSVDNLPNSLTHLIFGRCFNQSVDNLPSKLTHVTFGHFFDQKVDELPNSITHLAFGHNFNQKVDNLPNNLTHLTFGYWFYQSVDNLPDTLTHLTFGYYYNKPMNNLPSNIKEIRVCGNQLDSLKKTPFGCRIVDVNDSEIFI